MNSVCDNVRYVIFTETVRPSLNGEVPVEHDESEPNTQSTHSSNARTRTRSLARTYKTNTNKDAYSSSDVWIRGVQRQPKRRFALKMRN